jgi:ankyrin repeat protein
MSKKFKKDLKYYTKCIIDIVENGNSKALPLYLSYAFSQYNLINVRDNTDNTLLMIACKSLLSTLDKDTKKEYYEVINCLIHNGVDINYVNYSRYTELYCMKMKENTALIYAIENNNLELVKLLVSNGAFIDANIISIINEYTSIDIIIYFLSIGMDIELKNKDGNNLLMKSIKCRNYELTEVLITHGANINCIVHGLTPLIFALISYDFYYVKILIKNDANINFTDNFGNSTLMLALNICKELHGDPISFIDLFLTKDLDINHMSKGNKTALTIALDNNNYIIIKHIVINYITKIIIKDDNKIRILKKIMEQNDIEIIKLLVDNKVIEIEDILFSALYNNKIHIVFYLIIELGANINSINQVGKTLLFIAVENGNIELIEYLISRLNQWLFVNKTYVPYYFGKVIHGHFSPLEYACAMYNKNNECLSNIYKNIIIILSIEMIKRKIYIDTKLKYPFEFSEVIAEANWQSRKNLLELSDGCSDANGHIVRYLFNNLVQHEILSYIGYQDYLNTSN